MFRPSNPVLTLCSNDRVYRVKGDVEGNFKFTSIAPGPYDLVGAVHLVTPGLISHFALTGTESISALKSVLRPDTEPRSPCYVTTEGENLIRDFAVTYGTEAGVNSPLIEVEVLGSAYNRKHQINDTKTLPQAAVILFQSREADPGSSAKSGSLGLCTLPPATPRVYRLLMKVRGYYEVRVRLFLVTRENATKLTIIAALEGTVVLNQ